MAKKVIALEMSTLPQSLPHLISWNIHVLLSTPGIWFKGNVWKTKQNPLSWSAQAPTVPPTNRTSPQLSLSVSSVEAEDSASHFRFVGRLGRVLFVRHSVRQKCSYQWRLCEPGDCRLVNSFIVLNLTMDNNCGFWAAVTVTRWCVSVPDL